LCDLALNFERSHTASVPASNTAKGRVPFEHEWGTFSHGEQLQLGLWLRAELLKVAAKVEQPAMPS